VRAEDISRSEISAGAGDGIQLDLTATHFHHTEPEDTGLEDEEPILKGTTRHEEVDSWEDRITREFERTWRKLDARVRRFTRERKITHARSTQVVNLVGPEGDSQLWELADVEVLGAEEGE
jgi:hypothetical protein